MDTAWIAPPALLLGAAGVTAMLLRRLARTVEELSGSQRRARKLEGALIPLRVESRRAGDTLDRLTRQ